MFPTLVSVIVCTRNRAASLHRCLESFLGIRTTHRWELVVVNNGSTDSTEQVIESFTGRTEFFIRYILEPRKGVSCARNAGLAAAKGDPILFTDDDCYPAPDFIDQAVATIAGRQVSYFGGRVLLHDPDDYPTSILTATEAEGIPPNSFVPVGIAQGANMGFRREVFQSVGGFNELLGGGAVFLAGEDIEIMGRASAAGFAGGYYPEAVVYHHHGRKAADVPRLEYAYHIGRGAYYASMILSSPLFMTYLKNWYWRMYSPGDTWTLKLRLVRSAVAYLAVFWYRKFRGRHPIPAWTQLQP